MTRSGSTNKTQCVVCFRELPSNAKISQPLNPRKVFKVCTHYLRPEIFTKYSKWDFLNDVERQSPFCSMCVTSGEKLSAMEDRLEELQKEIISFVKYFAKEISRQRLNEENDNIDEVSQDSPQFLSDLNKRKDKTTRLSSSNSKTTVCSEAEEFNIMSQNEDSSNSNDVIYVKDEAEEQESAPEDVEYDLPMSVSDTNSVNEDLPEPPKNKRKGNNECPKEKCLKNDALKITKTTGKPSMRNLNRIPQIWTEIEISDEQLKTEWKRSNVSRAKSCVSEYFMCKVGGRECPVRLLKKTFVGVRYFINEKPHKHREGAENYGVSPEIKVEVLKLLDADITVKRGFMFAALASKGIEIPSKKQLVNLMEYERRKRLKQTGHYPKRPCENRKSTKSRPHSSSESADSMKRKRGRPFGSRRREPVVVIAPSFYPPVLTSELSAIATSLDDK